MALKSIFTMGLMATAALGAAIVREEPFRCGSKSNPQHRVISKMFAAEEAVARRLGQRAVENINVGVYMHVIAESLNDTAYLSVSSFFLVPRCHFFLCISISLYYFALRLPIR